MSMEPMWKPVPGYEGEYEVSDDGQVKSLLSGGLVLKPGTRKDGYNMVVLRGRVSRVIHQLVLEAFVGPRPEGMVARHLNGDPGDNRVENLAWGTRRENMLDRVAHGRDTNSAKTHCKQGHPFDEANTYLARKGRMRMCRTCNRAAAARYRARQQT